MLLQWQSSLHILCAIASAKRSSIIRQILQEAFTKWWTGHLKRKCTHGQSKTRKRNQNCQCSVTLISHYFCAPLRISTLFFLLPLSVLPSAVSLLSMTEKGLHSTHSPQYFPLSSMLTCHDFAPVVPLFAVVVPLISSFLETECREQGRDRCSEEIFICSMVHPYVPLELCTLHSIALTAAADDTVTR
jgi:hypothetical protein